MSTVLSKSKLSFKSEKSNEGKMCFPQIETMQDVVTNFFNQIVQYVISDMITIESEETLAESIESEVKIKDYKDLSAEDLISSEVSSGSGSKVKLTKKTSSRSERKKRKTSNLNVINENSEESLSKSSESLRDLQMEDERQMRIYFTNGCVYEGTILNRIMNGKGRYTWTDGTVYEGYFKDGFPTGQGWTTLPDLSHYDGEFYGGVFYGHGFLNVASSPSFYSGEWKDGKKHGQGWMLYEPGDWYEGGWSNDLKDGFGVRHYKNGSKYRGMWREGKFDGEGIMIWENNDYYKGEWSKGMMHGEGEYIWNAFYNNVFAFPIQNNYKGSWRHGKRSGEGVMHFGDATGIRLKGTWDQNFKHGPGYLICGNGQTLERLWLFQYDKLVQTDLTASTTSYFRNFRSSRSIDVSIFTAPEYVDVGYYIDQFLARTEDTNSIRLIKPVEEKRIRNVIIQYLPQLRRLYTEYASVATKTKLAYEPVLIRLFLWQFYKDKEIWKRKISLVGTDEILASNPKNCLDSLHDPFESIYFWQFLMSLIGVALTTASLESTEGYRGITADIVKTFFQEILSSDSTAGKNSLLLAYLDLAPIKAVYSFYKQLGEPHTARYFLRKACCGVRHPVLSCESTLFFKIGKPQSGFNLVPLDQYVSFASHDPESHRKRLGPGNRRYYTSLADFGHLGPRNIVRCLATACALIMDEDLVVNIDHPLTFFEFYETLLICIFVVLELELKKEQKLLAESVAPPTGRSKRRSSGTIDNKKRSSKEDKKGKRLKKSIKM